MKVDGPVQVVWTREDTFAHGMYRPLTVQTLRAGLDADGWPDAWLHRIYGQPPRGTTTGGAANPPYTLPNFRCDNHLEDWGIPIGPWRSVAHSQTAFAVESFMDECAHAAGRDPFEYRRHLMRDANPRLLRCLEMAAERAEWGRPMGERQGQGIAAWTCYTGYVGMVAEVTVLPDGTVRVDRIVSALHFVESTEPAAGVGEPPVPPTPPAVCNAIYAATGVRIRELPIDRGLLRVT